MTADPTLRIETFSNIRGGNVFYKAVSHPAAAAAMEALLARLALAGPIALYDPQGSAEALAQLYGLGRLQIAAILVQDIERIGAETLGLRAQPVTDVKAMSHIAAVLTLAFDADRLHDHIRHLLPAGVELASLDAARLPDDMLTNRRRYLDPLNFVTNFVFFRDAGDQHTRLVTCNYWAGYGAKAVACQFLLYDMGGARLAAWREPLGGEASALVVDSGDVRRRFRLPEFTGQLFLHVIGAAGHDVVKYALDTYGDGPDVLSCTHDANSWPADVYAGLPAPASGERVILWVQNSHPCPIPAGAIGLNLMADPRRARLAREIGPFATHALDVSELLPEARWPQQIEVHAGKYMVRPRYEVLAANGRRRIAHVNVERTDLKPDRRLAELQNLLGKGFILPAPILPPRRWHSSALPTPMATSQRELPIMVAAYDPAGRELAQRRLGRWPRDGVTAIDLTELLAGSRRGNGAAYGHAELLYDFAEGGEADGWLHALFRYQDRTSGHAAETSFGAHVFNTVLTYKGEPQSYQGSPPGLSTRLFLRLGDAPRDTLCHLIYPASQPWRSESETLLLLRDRDGREIARRQVRIPCGGSLLWRYHETFTQDERRAAGDRAHVLVRDPTCRLFGYHGLLDVAGAFSLDHMFGF